MDKEYINRRNYQYQRKVMPHKGKKPYKSSTGKLVIPKKKSSRKTSLQRSPFGHKSAHRTSHKKK